MKRDIDLLREIALDLRLNHAKRWPIYLTADQITVILTALGTEADRQIGEMETVRDTLTSVRNHKPKGDHDDTLD